MAEAALGEHSVRTRIVAVWHQVRCMPVRDCYRAIENAPRRQHDPRRGKAIRIVQVLRGWPEVPMQSGQALFRSLAAAIGCSDSTARQAVMLIARALELGDA